METSSHYCYEKSIVTSSQLVSIKCLTLPISKLEAFYGEVNLSTDIIHDRDNLFDSNLEIGINTKVYKENNYIYIPKKHIDEIYDQIEMISVQVEKEYIKNKIKNRPKVLKIPKTKKEIIESLKQFDQYKNVTPEDTEVLMKKKLTELIDIFKQINVENEEDSDEEIDDEEIDED